MKDDDESAIIIGNNNNHPNNDVQEQPLVGIKFSYIIGEFMEEHGGMDAFQGLTTCEVKEKFILPPTQKRQESYWDMLRRRSEGNNSSSNATKEDNNNMQLKQLDDDDSPCGITATAFISHAHQYQFLDTITAIHSYLLAQDKNDTTTTTTDGAALRSLREDPYIFFDIFCINQHRTDWSYKFLSTTFMNSIEKFGRTIVVMSPWNDPIPFTRAWCVYEAYCTIITGNKYEVALSQTEQIAFIQAILRDAEGVINKMLATIQSERSEAHHKEERDRIHSIIRESVGFSKLNALVFEQYRSWVIETSEAALKETTDIMMDNNNNNPTVTRAVLLHAIGRLFDGQGKYEQAQSRLEEAIKLFDEMLENEKQQEEKTVTLFDGLDDATKLRSQCMSNLALVYQKQKKFSQAEDIFKRDYEFCEQMIQNQKGAIDEEGRKLLYRSKLTAMGNLAYTYMSQKKFVFAEQLFVDCLEEAKQWLGENDQLTLNTMNNLGEMYVHQERWNKAEPLHEECVERLRKHHGPDHPMTITCTANLAVVYRKQGKNTLAEPLYVETLAKRREQLGNDHPLTIQSVMNLSTCYSTLGKFELAEPLQEEFLAAIENEYEQDNDHDHDNNNNDPNIIRTHWSNMAYIYTERAKYEKAEVLLRKCLTKCPSMNHPDAMQYIQRLNDLQARKLGGTTTEAVSNEATEQEAENKNSYLCCGMACLAFVVIGIAVRNLSSD